ncbi:MAG: hypothetical protein KME57_33510 [Scytonema hyalinum WJT4-NPBG1]|nr:hypothetical protein [Scytonema hyalinum WJT4-NPBG1]
MVSADHGAYSRRGSLHAAALGLRSHLLHTDTQRRLGGNPGGDRLPPPQRSQGVRARKSLPPGLGSQGDRPPQHSSPCREAARVWGHGGLPRGRGDRRSQFGTRGVALGGHSQLADSCLIHAYSVPASTN